jgi:RES domain-containing protein
VRLHAWRICKAEHADTAFSGGGARRFGGRWNSRGTAVVYSADSAALAALEMLVHLRVAKMLSYYVIVEIAFDSALVDEVDRKPIPADWRADPAPEELRLFGDRWIRAERSAVLKVPSALIESEHNFLLNPAHRDFGRIRIGAAKEFQFDKRLLR